MRKIIEIHPFDLGGILKRIPYNEMVILRLPDPEFPGREIVKVKNKTYRQTIDVRIKTAFGKKLESDSRREAL